ncbi:hypothetical protein K7432_017834 [Basidiobolus ranarum]|uniref:Uncharacterized protein n=1 Tax=Basidiobolus ranarum TaxID=34480 RepID=A0ABR2WCV4_9FUNG
MVDDSILLTPLITLLAIIWLALFVLPASLVYFGFGLVSHLRSHLFQKKPILLNGEANAGTYKSILITGAANGIGRELALSYASLDTTTCLGLVDVSGKVLEKTAQEISELFPKVQVETYTADVTNSEEMSQLVKDFDKHGLDLVIANAGVYITPRDGTAKLTDYSEWADDVRKTMEVNYTGVINTIAPAISLFKTRKSGHVVVTSSLSALYGPPVLASYSASKAAIFRFVRDLGSQLKKENIYTTCVCPGFIDTTLTQSTFQLRKGRKLPLLMTTTQAAKSIVEGIARKDETIAFPFAVHALCWLLHCTPPFIMNRIQRFLPES